MATVLITHTSYVETTSDWPYQEAHALQSDVYPPPLKQHDVPTHQIQCNAPRNLYIAWDTPLCLFAGTYDTLVSRGVDIVKVSADTSLTLTDEEISWLKENPIIRVAYDPNWPPIEYIDESGNLAGVTARYIDEFEQITGAAFQPTDIVDWPHALETMRDGTADVIFMVSYTDERAEYMGFTTPHYTIETRLITLQDTTLDITDENLRLMTIRDYAIEAWLDQTHPDISYISADDIYQGFEMLQRGEADAVALNWIIALSAADDIMIYDAGPTGHAYHLSVGYPDDLSVLGSILQKTLDIIPESTLESMQDLALLMP